MSRFSVSWLFTPISNLLLLTSIRYDLMLQCWQTEPGLRPPFTVVFAQLTDIATEEEESAL